MGLIALYSAHFGFFAGVFFPAVFGDISYCTSFYDLAICACHKKIRYLERAFLDHVFSSIEIDMQLLAQQSPMFFSWTIRNYPQVS